MIDNAPGMYRAYDGTNNAFYALADNSAAQAIFRIDDEAFEKKLIAYKRAAYEEGAISIETRKIFENCNIITVFYFEDGEKEQSREKYCWQYDIESENARFFASLMGSESILYKKGNKITLYEVQKPKSTTELMESPPITYIDNTSAESARQNPIDDMPPERTVEKPGGENLHKAADRLFPKDTERQSRTKSRCRRLMKKSGKSYRHERRQKPLYTANG